MIRAEEKTQGGWLELYKSDKSEVRFGHGDDGLANMIRLWDVFQCDAVHRVGRANRPYQPPVIWEPFIL